MRDIEFVNYTQASGLKPRENSRQVASYVGKYHRNRSAPSSRATLTSKSRRGQGNLTPTVQEPEGRSAVGVQPSPSALVPNTIPRDWAGFRGDPFDTLPIRQSKAVSVAIDYYAYSYAPSHLIQPNSKRSRDQTNFIQQHLQDVIYWPTMFEAVLALAYSNLATINAAQSTLKTQALYHYGRAVSLLRQSLRDGVTGDAELFSIVSLMGVNYLWDDLDAFQTNLGGLRQILAWRGGLNSLKWVELLEPAILTIEAFWVYISQQTHLLPQPSLSVTSITTDVGGAVDYEALVSALPIRFQQLAQEQRLSLSVVRAILEEVEFSTSILFDQPAGFVHYDGVRKFASLKTKSGEDINIVSHIQTIRNLARLFGSSHLTKEDIVCCIGMFINALCVLRTEQLSPIFFKQIQHHTRQLIECNVNVNDTVFRDLLAWAMFNVASTMVPSRTIRSADSPLSDLRHHLFSKIASLFPTSQWYDLKLILQGFITSEICLTVFEQVWNLAIQHKSSVA